MPVSSGGSVDAAYILATPEQIGYIKPMIAMRNGSQSNVTLYASSRSAQGTAGPDFRLEMEGLQYSEIPMLAGSNPALMQQALSAVRNDYSLARLYAMGADAWSLANHFTQMRQTPGFELNGNTGDLTATQDCVITRNCHGSNTSRDKSSRPAKQTDRRCMGKPCSPLAGKPWPVFYCRQCSRAWRRN